MRVWASLRSPAVNVYHNYKLLIQSLPPVLSFFTILSQYFAMMLQSKISFYIQFRSFFPPIRTQRSGAMHSSEFARLFLAAHFSMWLACDCVGSDILFIYYSLGDNSESIFKPPNPLHSYVFISIFPCA